MTHTRKPRWIAGLLAMIVCAGLALPALAQPRGGGQGGDRGGGRGGRGGRGGWDPARMQEMMMERLKDTLEIGDAEWPAIKPLLADVMTKQREARGGGMGRMFGRGRGRNEEDTPAAVADLQAALENDGSSSADIKTKLEAYRAYMKTKQEELAVSRAKLLEVLTVKQEARLVMMGMLE